MIKTAWENSHCVLCFEYDSVLKAREDSNMIVLCKCLFLSIGILTDLYVCLKLFLSIEYWPDPQRGIKEAYRLLKIGGKACIIGPVYPTFWLSRFFADMWMLFPKEEEYIEWFQKAGFKDVKLKRIGPKWYRGVRRHGLIMGCSVTGVKPLSGDSPLQVTYSLVVLAF